MNAEFETGKLLREMNEMRGSFRKKYHLIYKMMLAILIFVIVEFWLLIYLILRK